MKDGNDGKWAKRALWLGPLVAILVDVARHLGGLHRRGAHGRSHHTLRVLVDLRTHPVPATSLIPFAALPLLNVVDHKAVAGAYGHTLILLLLGGFILSMAMEKSGAHRRLALGMVRMVGGRGGRRLVLGFMLATAVCSMWISNTATVLMLMPVAAAVLSSERESLRVPLLLGIAYSASIGGLGTPVGTPPNVIFIGQYEELVGQEMGFIEWMKIGIPAVVIMLPLAWLWLTRNIRESQPVTLPPSGPWSLAEKRVLWVFGFTALAWVTRGHPMGGWSHWLHIPGAGDSTVALLSVVALFLIPDGRNGRMLDWETANRIPWGLLLLFGGGIAIAKAFDSSGLAQALGDFLAHDLGIASWPAVAMIATLCFTVTFLTEITSNTATTTLLMPVLFAAAVSAGLAPEALMIPATLSASCAFMLPVATAPNAVVYGTGHVTTRQMAREGLVLNLVGVVILTGLCT